MTGGRAPPPACFWGVDFCVVAAQMPGLLQALFTVGGAAQLDTKLCPTRTVTLVEVSTFFEERGGSSRGVRLCVLWTVRGRC